MNKSHNLFIRNIYSCHEDKISTSAVFNCISKAAGKRCGLHDKIYESLLITGLREYIDGLNAEDAEKLRLYAECRGIQTDDEHYFQARNAENRWREKREHDQM